jgi:hypothetical protein
VFQRDPYQSREQKVFCYWSCHLNLSSRHRGTDQKNIALFLCHASFVLPIEPRTDFLNKDSRVRFAENWNYFPSSAVDIYCSRERCGCITLVVSTGQYLCDLIGKDSN